MTNAVSTAASDPALVGAILRRTAADLGLMLGHDLELEEPRLERARTRPAGEGCVHISFKLALSPEGRPARHGALLVPLPDAMTLACFLLMMPAETAAAQREDAAPDGTLKDALLEIGNLVGAATSTALSELGLAGWSARSEGCQGVREGIRPAFPYQEGSQLIVARVRARLEPFPPFELILVLPALE